MPARVRLILLSLVLVLPVSAQRGTEGRAYVSLYGGMGFGAGLWSLDRQPVSSTTALGVTTDTVSLGRDLGSGVSAGFGAYFFPSARLGLGFDLGYSSFRLKDNCVLVYDSVRETDFNPNRRTCDFIRRNNATSTVPSVGSTVIFRPFPYSDITPYLRAIGGVHARINTVRVAGPNETFIESRSSPTLRPMLGMALGGTRPTDRGVQFKWEIRWLNFRTETVNGVADSQKNAPSSTRWFSSFSFALGIDFVIGAE